MAVIKKKGSKDLPALSTASLPDVIFMILFFFMVSTSMREQDLKVMFTVPVGSEVQKLEKKSLVSYIYVGPPTKALQAQFGTSPRIQLNDSYSQPRDIRDFVASERNNLKESDRGSMTISIKADKMVRMGLITDIKQELRRANALKISYTAGKGRVDGKDL